MARPSSPGSIRSSTTQVVALARELLVHRRRVGHRLDLVAFAAEVAHQQVAQALVVVDHEDAGLQFSHWQ